MAKITFITKDQKSITAESHSGNVMYLAVRNKVKGIYAECGGICSCATCHVYVAPEDMTRVGQASQIEKDLLEFDDNVTDYSRLACQIPITEALDGIVLQVANE